MNSDGIGSQQYAELRKFGGKCIRNMNELTANKPNFLDQNIQTYLSNVLPFVFLFGDKPHLA